MSKFKFLNLQDFLLFFRSRYLRSFDVNFDVDWSSGFWLCFSWLWCCSLIWFFFSYCFFNNNFFFFFVCCLEWSSWSFLKRLWHFHFFFLWLFWFLFFKRYYNRCLYLFSMNLIFRTNFFNHSSCTSHLWLSYLSSWIFNLESSNSLSL